MTGFEELYRRYAQDVFRFAFWLSGDRAEAEDIASETFVRAWVGAGDLRMATVKAYLIAIARNLYLQRQRRSRRRRELDASLPDPGPGPERQLERRDELRAVMEQLQGLPEADRAALLMHAELELPYEEIARVGALAGGGQGESAPRADQAGAPARRGRERAMNVTRDVVIDLLPLVLAGEASEDSRALVESYLEKDPELARIARARAARLSTERAPEPLEKEVEMKALMKTKKLLNWRSVLFAGAVLFSVFPVYFSRESRGPHWLPLDSPVGAVLSAALAVLFWAGVLWIRRALRGKAT